MTIIIQLQYVYPIVTDIWVGFSVRLPIKQCWSMGDVSVLALSFFLFCIYINSKTFVGRGSDLNWLDHENFVQRTQN